MNDETGDDSDSVGFFDRIKESPRTVSALIIILIVAAAIYAFSGEPKKDGDELANNNEPAVTEENGAMDVVDDADEEENMDKVDDTVAPKPPVAPTPAQPPVVPGEKVSAEKLQEMNRALPPVERADRAYVEAAQAGDGITHLARRATTRWLAENNAGYEITNEHRVYIEDYIQNKLGSDRLSVGETRTISFDLIAEAVKSAGELNGTQLNNLSHYTVALN